MTSSVSGPKLFCTTFTFHCSDNMAGMWWLIPCRAGAKQGLQTSKLLQREAGRGNRKCSSLGEGKKTTLCCFVCFQNVASCVCTFFSTCANGFAWQEDAAKSLLHVTGKYRHVLRYSGKLTAAFKTRTAPISLLTDLGRESSTLHQNTAWLSRYGMFWPCK